MNKKLIVLSAFSLVLIFAAVNSVEAVCWFGILGDCDVVGARQVRSDEPLPFISINIDYPEDGMIVSGVIQITAVAKSSYPIDKMILDIIGGEEISQPFENCKINEDKKSMLCYNFWDTSSYAGQLVKLTATAYDEKGQKANDRVEVKVIKTIEYPVTYQGILNMLRDNSFSPEIEAQPIGYSTTCTDICSQQHIGIITATCIYAEGSITEQEGNREIISCNSEVWVKGKKEFPQGSITDFRCWCAYPPNSK